MNEPGETPFVHLGDAVVLHIERDGICVYRGITFKTGSSALSHHVVCEHGRIFDIALR